MSGILLIDKAEGCTSHDVVRLARRAFKTRAVGHAGTLDPMATGVLVLLLDEGTKLSPFLTLDRKTYQGRVELGTETDSLDRDGSVVATAPVPENLNQERVQEVANQFLGTIQQQVPAFSAVKVDGQRLYARARRGEAMTAPARDVSVYELRVTEVHATRIDFCVTASKGFYVRALARDLAHALGTVGHLTQLRRVKSGLFTIEETLPTTVLERAAHDEPEAIEQVQGALRSLPEACRGLPQYVLNEEGMQYAKHGRALHVDQHLIQPLEPNLSATPTTIALLDASNTLIAMGALSHPTIKILRGFNS